MLVRAAALLCLLVGPVPAQEHIPTTPLRNVELVDKDGLTTKLYGFYRLSGEDVFRGYLGAGEIEVPYERIHEFHLMAAAHPAGRPRVRLTLRTGKTIDATFDQREAEQLLTGYSRFGRVTIFFRDVRRLKLLGHTSRKDLPVYGPATRGFDVRLKDKQGVTTELVKFRRTVNANVIPAIRGSASVAIPLRVLKRVAITPGTTTLAATATLKDGTTVDFQLPSYVEEIQYRGEAPFGIYRIRLGKIREIVFHRPTPILRDLDPLDAARGEEKREGQPGR